MPESAPPPPADDDEEEEGSDDDSPPASPHLNARVHSAQLATRPLSSSQVRVEFAVSHHQLVLSSMGLTYHTMLLSLKRVYCRSKQAKG